MAHFSRIIDSFTKRWSYLCEDLVIVYANHAIYFDRIIIPPEQRCKGIGSSILIELCELADKYKKEITVYPSGVYGSKLPRLYKFYQRFGFEFKKQDKMLVKWMIRKPQ